MLLADEEQSRQVIVLSAIREVAKRTGFNVAFDQDTSPANFLTLR
jgi:hypothetical protein